MAARLLTTDGPEQEQLFASARKIRDTHVGAKLELRAVIDLSNKCRVNCKFCPMRRDNSRDLKTTRITTDEATSAAILAYEQEFQHLFLQSGEETRIIPIVLETLQNIKAKGLDMHVILNLGNHSLETYKALLAAGGHGYLIKHETANAALHLALREETLERRVAHMLLARQAGFYIGSGNIAGLPGQTDHDLARDLIFLGRIGSARMASCAPFTPSESLPVGFQEPRPGTFEKTLRFIALLRHCFPNARIPATSNLDSPHLMRPAALAKSGQAMALDAGANGITVQFTPDRVEDSYALYERGSDKRQHGYLVGLEKAKTAAQQAGLALGLSSQASFATSDLEVEHGYRA